MTGQAELSAESKYRLLFEISQKISGVLELDEVLDHLIGAADSVVPYDAAGIFVLNRDLQPLRRSGPAFMIAGMAMRGFPPKPRVGDPMLTLGKGIVGRVIRTGQSVVVPDVTKDPHYIVGRPESRSEVAVPIMIRGKVIGALNLESDRVDAYGDSDVDMLRFFANAAAISIEKAILHQQLLEKKRIERQLEIAREVQVSLLPEAPPHYPGYDIAGINLPTWQIGGDYFDWIGLPDGDLGIAIADVSGKGVPSALTMATFRAALRSHVSGAAPIASLLDTVNSFLLQSTGPQEFVTAVYGVLQRRTGRFTYANCGHNPPLLLRSDGSTARLDRGGTVLGIIAGAGFEAVSEVVGPGDILVLFTDGVTEVTDPHGLEYGTERLLQTLRQNAGGSAQEMIDAVTKSTRFFSRADGYEDDFTLVIVKREASAAR